MNEIIQFIPLSERNNQKELINEIGNTIFGTDESTKFAEEFIPPRGRVPSPKNIKFANFLAKQTRCLWVVYTDEHKEQIAGFILVADLPHPNAIGFGLNPTYKRKGLMSRAWKEIMLSGECIRFPINAYTSEKNTGAINFLQKNKFQFIENLDFVEEPSVHYSFNKQ